MLRTTLSASGMLSAVKEIFDKIPDSCVARSNITLTDCLMSGLAIFSLKFPSLLQFEHAKEEIRIKQNLKNLYQINQAPSDTYLRDRLDLIDPFMLRQPFKKMFSLLQRGNALEQFSYIDGHYQLSLDGTGYFHSHTVHCESCCMKQYSNGTFGYYHSMLCAALVNPNYKEVIPFAPEPIIQQDGNTKNDCEQNASKRMLEHIRREHPHLKLIIIEDALSASGPHIQLLKKHRMSFIIGCKNNHDYLFKYRQDLVTKHEILSEEGTRHLFQFANQIPLNSSHPDIKINRALA
jgi:hypothetical protein